MISIIIQFIVIGNALQCSPGCPSCLTNYTCASHCLPGYEQDNSCTHCQWVNPYKKVTEAYIPSNDKCLKTTNVIQKTEWLPSDIQEIKLNERIVFTLDNDSSVDYSFCQYKQKYRFGKWFKINLNQVTNAVFVAEIEKVNKAPVIFSLDMTNSNSFDQNPHCYAHNQMNKDEYNFTMMVPAYKPHSKKSDEFIYLFASIEGSGNAEMSLTVSQMDGKYFDPYYIFTQELADSLAADLTKEEFVHFPVKARGIHDYSYCAQCRLMKFLLFRMNFKGDYSILLDSTAADKVNYLQEYTENNTCKVLYIGKPFGHSLNRNNGFKVRIRGDEISQPTDRLFTVLTEDKGSDIDVVFRAICPHDCNHKLGQGICVTEEGRCRCNPGFGGDDCHKLCYYDNQWQIENHNGLCKYGTYGCDSYCQCDDSNYILRNSLCVYSSCLTGKLGPKDECLQGSDGCTETCRCDTENGFFRTENKKCKYEKCGNGIIDTITFSDGTIKKEQCDGGVNCDSFCDCVNGYIPDPDNPGSCMSKRISTGAIIGIIVGSSVGLLFIMGLFIFLFFVLLRYERADIEVFKQQQPTYHYYINGSLNREPLKINRYKVFPSELDYGNENGTTDIEDTRFERIEVKNYSKNKHMMIIFHTPNNPKFVFHFEPQVLFIRPHSPSKIITSYMTLHCTTKIRDMKIPYTVWFSKSKSTLETIAELLKDKTFNDWTQDNQRQMEKLCKSVAKHYHYNLTIITDAASSTHIDMDELNMSEKPIAEGAMGQVYIGSYRSVPVAVKVFKWQNLTEEEMDELKQEVIAECEMMSKLRNPFIANYMGSVTYLPQVTMVIQYFVLGSLGEYLRTEKEDFIKLSYKLKIKMLFDTARGMEFLHENNILHLDLKPDNLLVNSLYADSACCVKITDFGTSRVVKKKSNNEDKGLGTPIYAAPETYFDRYSFASDVYSFGISAWEVFYQDEPYKEFKSIFEIKNYVESGKRLPLGDTMPQILKEVISDSWKQEPEQRITFEQITRLLLKADDESGNHSELDIGVSDAKVEELILKRTQRMQNQICDLNHD
ncbi:hypothetical protein ENUP19_0063G0036 [Entamoeba nuttalli]|uniref:Protein tyrosine kinase domain containing protein n=1 Tax=Entamoeba nuttalli TaxID=412467 RepID=A0ABQ0DDZ7_9EUKA